MLTESPHVLNTVVLLLVLILIFTWSKEFLSWVYKECISREKVVTEEELEKIRVLENVKREMERRRQRKIVELKARISSLESERLQLQKKVQKEKEEEELEKLKILVQKNYEEEQKVLAERALHDKEADLEVMEKLYLDARRQVVMLDVKDALLKNKVRLMS
jgi:E3 ubiquitin-protein ligase DOA10